MVDILHLVAKSVPLPETVFLERVLYAVAQVIPGAVPEGQRRQALAAIQRNGAVFARHVGDYVASAKSFHGRSASIDKHASASQKREKLARRPYMEKRHFGTTETLNLAKPFRRSFGKSS